MPPLKTIYIAEDQCITYKLAVFISALFYMEISPDPLSLKRLFTKNQNWHSYYQYHQNNGLPMREEVPWAITQILSCKNYVKGHAQYYCSIKSCLHEKRVPFTCKHRMCNSCGKVASDKWVAKQKQVLPKCSFQHITFTKHCELWPIFDRNRHLQAGLHPIGSA